MAPKDPEAPRSPTGYALGRVMILVSELTEERPRTDRTFEQRMAELKRQVRKICPSPAEAQAIMKMWGDSGL